MNDKIHLKKLLGNSMWQISEKIITMLISMVVLAIVSRYLGTEQYGIVNYIISIVMLFTTFSTLGMEEITIKDIIDKNEKKEAILGTSFIIRIIGGICLTLLSEIAIYILNGLNKTYMILGAIMGSCMLFKAFEVVEYYLQSQLKLKITSIIRFITTIVVAVSRILVVVLDWGMVGFIFTYLVDAIVAGFLFYIYYKKRQKVKWKFDQEYAKKLLSRCWYIAVSGLMVTIYMRIDQIMLGTMLVDKSENGIYSAATKIAEMWYFVPIAIIASFQPAIAQKKNENQEEYISMMQKLYDIIAIVGVLFGIIISMFGWIAVDMLYGVEYAKASSVLVISTWAGLFATLGNARSVWLINENLQRYTLIYTLVGSIVNILLNIIMIPRIGAYGAAIATLIAQFISNVFALMIFKKTRESSIMILKAIFLNSILIQIGKKIKNSIRHKENE